MLSDRFVVGWGEALILNHVYLSIVPVVTAKPVICSGLLILAMVTRLIQGAHLASFIVAGNIVKGIVDR